MIPLNKKKFIYLTEIFKSIQGETSFAGLPTLFIRTAGCNLRCSWCDTTYSFSRGTATEISAIIDQAVESNVKHICITGGEPLIQENVFELMTLLCDKNFSLSLETGGSISVQNVDPRVTSIIDIKCPGSGMESKNFWQNLILLRPQDEVKFVVKDREDYDYAKKICSKYALFQRKNPILISPVHDVMDTQELVKWILEDSLPIRLNLQIHKYIWNPSTRGV